MPALYETSGGNLWLNHTVWDGVSMATFSFVERPGKHFSVHEDRVLQLKSNWTGGPRAVDRVLKGPKIFPQIEPFKYVEKVADFSLEVADAVKVLSTRTRVPLETAWHAFSMVMMLQCTEKASGVFWIQDSNRDAVNADVFGYVTTEVGCLIQVDAAASFEIRFNQCVQILVSLSTEHRNTFPEFAYTNPAYETFMETSMGINLTGSGGVDWTDRRLVFESLLRNNVKSAADAELFYGKMNWMEIGLDGRIAFKGRVDIVEFGLTQLVPAMCKLAKALHIEKVELAEAEFRLTVQERLGASDEVVAKVRMKKTRT
eukprot:5649225-Prymnesium_polylepis.1